MSFEKQSETKGESVEQRILSLRAKAEEANATYDSAGAAEFERQADALEAEGQEVSGNEPNVMEKLQQAQASADPVAIADAERNAANFYAVNKQPVEATLPPEVVETGEQSLSVENLISRLDDLRNSLAYIGNEDVTIRDKGRFDWYKAEEGIIALEDNQKNGKDAYDLDVFLRAKHPDLLEKFEKNRIIYEEIDALEIQIEDMKTTNISNDPKMLPLLGMTDDIALGYISRKQRHGMGDYHGFDIDGETYIAASKSVLDNPDISEEEKLKKIATLHLLVGGGNGGYMDRYRHLIEDKLTGQQREVIKKLENEISAAASKVF